MKTIMILSLLIAPAVMAAPCADQSYPEIDRAELNSLIEKKAVFVVDVNSKESFAKTHIPGAIHFASVKDEFAAKLPADKNSLIVAYCGGPSCTAWKKAAIKACESGYTNIKHFKPGIKGWKI